jgi:hypothetical protein
MNERDLGIDHQLDNPTSAYTDLPLLFPVRPDRRQGGGGGGEQEYIVMVVITGQRSMKMKYSILVRE